VGFIIKRTDIDSTLFLEEHAHITSCLFEDDKIINANNGDRIVAIQPKRFVEDISITAGQEGFYNTYFVNCLAQPVSFNLLLTQYNSEGDSRSYLAAGDAPLPALTGTLSGTYLVVLGVWVLIFMRSPGAAVNRVHHLMTCLIVLKMLSLVFRTVDLAVTAREGTAGGWAIVYYSFAGAKGGLMFVLIALIGTGWKFIKPFLAKADKRIFMVVVPLQVIDNIALFVIEGSAPGSRYFASWKDLFRIVDILCCGAILIPIIWSIKHLREASQIDGKAARNMRKLQLFRQFYVMVVSYVYFTRIIIYLLDATLPFRFVWLGELCTELATLVFFGITGYKFRPAADNPYFELSPNEVDSDDENNANKGVEI
jgi:G protein-coupled receptor 107